MSVETKLEVNVKQAVPFFGVTWRHRSATTSTGWAL
jgi:hypothetical protein